MNHNYSKKLIALLLTSLFSQSYIANTEPAGINDILITNSYGQIQPGTRCGTVDQLNLHLPRAPDNLNSWRIDNPKRETELTIPIAFHIITKTDGTGNVTDEQVHQQIDILNKSYANMKIRFILKSLNRIKNNFYYSANPGFEEFFMKLNVSTSPKDTLNIYTASPSGGVLGYATLPWSFPESSFLHGVVVLNESLPGGKSTNYNEGKTVVHEVGHYLGLYHTFQNGCIEPGDEVDDTPFHAEANHGCPLNSDTCTSAGGDPIRNFMNYTYDTCMNEFTLGQEDRIDWSIKTYKKGLLQ